jgi:hypothetical protein
MLFDPWNRRELWQRIFTALAVCGGASNGRHGGQHGGVRERGQQNLPIGRSRGSPAGKLHALANGQGKYYVFSLGF